MYLVRDDKRSGGEINSPFFTTRKGLVVKTSKRTYPAVEINEAIYSAMFGVVITLMLLCLGFFGFIPPSRVNVLLFVSLVTASLRVLWNLKRAEDAFKSLRNGLLDNIDHAHLYLRIQRYARALGAAYHDIADARSAGSEEVEELEKKARKAQAEFWTFLNNLRVNVVRNPYSSRHYLNVLYGESFKSYLAPVETRPWDDFTMPLEESAK